MNWWVFDANEPNWRINLLKSMTAFARIERREPWGELSCELRSVNHRYLEVSLRLPEELRALETQMRNLLRERMARGKLDLTMKVQSGSESQAKLTVDEQMLDALTTALDVIGHKIGPHQPPSPADLLNWPGLVNATPPQKSALAEAAAHAVKAAADALIKGRLSEGEKLQSMLFTRLGGMREQVAVARARRPQLLEDRRQKLLDRLASCKAELDEHRLEQEMVLFAQRIDTDEELDRLDAHLQELEQLLASDEPVGRRLDFLMQELNREANTLASKANDLETTRAAVSMKVLIEQMREQVQNIE